MHFKKRIHPSNQITKSLNMTLKKENRFIIVGGGIGGLATALGLAQHGIKSIVLEKSSKLGEIGAGIQLGPNAFHGFDYLGVGDQARQLSVYFDDLILMDAIKGDEITRISLGERFRERFKNPYDGSITSDKIVEILSMSGTATIKTKNFVDLGFKI